MRPLALTLLTLTACNLHPQPPADAAPADAAPAAVAPAAPPAVALAPPTLSGLADTLPDVAERAVRSVVNISTRRVASARGVTADPLHRRFRGVPAPRSQASLGSGVIVDAEGVVLTNNHVIEGADEIEVTLSDGRELRAELVGADPATDLAVLRLIDPPADLVALPPGDSDALRLGEVVLAVGNPFGVGQTVTMGIVSAKGRAEVGIVDYEDFIQTDAAINPGNSGGALVDLRGRLVGINTAILSRSGGSQGVGFAIPARMASRVMAQLLDGGEVRRGWLGVAIQDLDPTLARALALPEGVDGVLIADVQPGGPGERLGLARGDLVLRVGGHATPSAASLRNAVAEAGAGARVTVEVLRAGERVQLAGELGERGAEGEAPAATASAAGLSLRALDAPLRERLGLPADAPGGVLIEDVDPSGPGARAGLRPGDVVLELNRQPVRSPEDLARAWLASGPGALLLLWRDGRTVYVALAR